MLVEAPAAAASGKHISVARDYPVQVRTFNTKAEAEAWAAVVESEIARGVFICRAEAEGTTLREALARYRAEIVPTKKQPGREGRRADALVRQIGAPSHRSLASIRGKDIVAYIKSRMVSSAGPNTVRLDLALLSHLFCSLTCSM